MNKQQAAKRWRELAEEIRRNDRLYFRKAAPVISDESYDALVRELVELESSFPELAGPDSPSRRVGGGRDEAFPPFAHEIPMLSLSNTYRREELGEFFARAARGLELESSESLAWNVEPKVDGVALSLRYEGGRLVSAATRGDGSTGDEVTTNVCTFTNLPSRLPRAVDLTVRGEAYMDRERFRMLNEARAAAGQELFANPRNLTAGTLKLLDSREVARRGLSFVTHGVIGTGLGGGIDAATRVVQELGLPVLPERRLCAGEEQVFAWIERLDAIRGELPFEIDGAVVKLDDYGLQERLGATAKSPRWGIAFKYAAQRAETRVREITLAVGRTGAVTPVAELEPVLLSGSTVSRATLHNREEIERKDIRVGDVVLVEKGGEIIPKVVAVLTDRRDGRQKPFRFPERCPSCDAALVSSELEVAVRCENPSCPAQLLRRLEHFVSRGALDIAGLGSQWIEILAQRGLVKRFADLYDLGTADLLPIDRMGERSASNLIAGIEASKRRPWRSKIFALGIRQVGAETARVLAGAFPDLESLRSANVDELVELPDVGPIVAAAIVDYFAHPPVAEELAALAERGFFAAGEEDPAGPVTDSLAGLVFVITGSFGAGSRDEMKKRLEAAGARVTGSVSAKTDVLLAGEAPGGKLEKAEQLGVAIWDEARLSRELGEAGDSR